MSHLDWKDESIRFELASSSRIRTQLILSISQTGLSDFCSNLEEICSGEASELRLILPENWVVFWKLRESGNRILLAHPQPDHWVATVALEQAMARDLIASLKGLKRGESLKMNRIGLMDSVSNLEIEWTRLD